MKRIGPVSFRDEPSILTIYKLIDPRDLSVRYIGKTNKIRRRSSFHIYAAKADVRNQHVYNWIKILIALKLKPIIEVVETNIETEKLLSEREIYWVKTYRARGHDLTNENDGGLGFGVGNKVWVGRKHSEATKKKMSKSAKGRKRPVETRLNMSRAHRKNFGDPNYKSKLSRGIKSKKVIAYDVITKKRRTFASILECASVLGFSRRMISLRAKQNELYVNYKFKIIS